MPTFTKDQFARTGRETYLGKTYAGYWTIELVHVEKKTKVDILLNANGDLVSAANAITDLIRKNFVLEGMAPKIIPVIIDSQPMIAIKWPPVPKSLYYDSA